MNPSDRPWRALWAMLIGFFMILVDTTIVAIANPVILRELNADLTSVMWVTSAYLLAYAVPLLITGRLGDRFGPKRMYLAGLVVFTLASFACGIADGIGMLIAARAVQGLGAAMMTPQTMAVITRTFPPHGRGAAMGVWGSVAGVAALVGPLLGGLLVDSLGWEWIFFVNVPVGIIAFIAAWRLVPNLETLSRRIDWLGVALSAIGMFLLVFGIQEGGTYEWGTIAGPISVWGLVVTGLVFLVLFVLWQRFMRGEPLLPLSIYRDRNFSLSNAAGMLLGVGITALPMPLAFYFQVARGLDPTLAALMIAPMPIISGILGPFVGRLSDRVGPRWVSFTSFSLAAGALVWYSVVLTPDQPLWLLLFPSALLGLAVSGVFSPIASTVTRNLPHKYAGAGSGVYTMTRQVGSVLGSAAITALLAMRLAAEIPGFAGDAAGGQGPAASDAFVYGYAAAMAQGLLLPAAAFGCCALIVVFLVNPPRGEGWGGEGWSEPVQRAE